MTSEQLKTDSRKRKVLDSEADGICPSKDKRDGCHQVSFSIPSLLEKIHDEKKKKKPINTPPFGVNVNPPDDQKKSRIGIFIKNHKKRKEKENPANIV